jgi:bifunctional non-homologous end joining protein LigD
MVKCISIFCRTARAQPSQARIRLRPKPGATVSMPLHWDEVKPGLTMKHFTIHNSIARLKKEGDLFKGVLGEGIDLEKTITKAKSIFQP